MTRRLGREDVRDLIVMALCVVLGLFAKRLVSPATSLLSDLLRMPGGGLSGGIGMAFLVLGAALVRRRWAGTLMGLLQGALALALGLSGLQGVFALLTYTVPGAVLDAVRAAFRWDPARPGFFLLAACLANAASAAASNLVVFHFTGLVFLLWVAMAASAGLLGGWIAGLAHRRLAALGVFRRQGGNA